MAHHLDTEEVVEQLEEHYSDEQIPDSLEELKEMILSLELFEDLESEINDYRLEEIREQWISLRENL